MSKSAEKNPNGSIIPFPTANDQAWPGQLRRLPANSLRIGRKRILLRWIILLLATLLTASIIIRVDRVVTASGTLVAVEGRADVRSPVTGVITAVLVSDGDRVVAGQPLLRLDSSQARGQFERSRRNLRACERLLVELKKSVISLEAAIAGEQPEPVSQAAAALEHWRKAMQAVAQAERQNREVYPAQLDLAKASIDARKAGVAAARAEHQKADAAYQRIALLAKRNITGQQTLEDAQAARDSAKSRETEAIALLKQEESNRHLYTVSMSTKLKTAEEMLELANASLRDEAARLRELVATTTTECSALEAEFKASEQSLARRTVRAPRGGLVVFAAQLAASTHIAVGQPICAIASTSIVYAVGNFRNRDAGLLKLGARCKIKLDAYPFANYGIIGGRIEEIAVEPIMDAEGIESIYPAKVLLERLTLGFGERIVTLTPGLTLTIEAVTERPRLIAMLLGPLLRLTADHAESVLDTPANREQPGKGTTGAQSMGAGQVREPAWTGDAFDTDRSFADLEALVEIGPRWAGSKGATAAREYLVAELTKAGLVVEREPFTAQTPEGDLPLENVFARLPAQSGTANEQEPAILLGTHLDTKRLKAYPAFSGANDGASGVAVLLECARILAKETNLPPILFAFFDGKEPLGGFAWEDGLFGSRAFVDKLLVEGRSSEIRAALIVDMVGDRDLRFTDEVRSTAWLADLARASGDRQNLADFFERGRPGAIPVAIPNDHLPFLRANLPATLLIDYDFGGSDPVRRIARNRYWHTSEDRIERVSAKSLGVAGRVVLESVAELHRTVR